MSYIGVGNNRGNKMARVVGSIAELAGKLGGTIWQRTRAGAIVKAYTRPVDARSLAQSRARARFSSAVRAYSATTPEQRASWAAYAGTDGLFVPTQGVNKGQYTGQQAFVSLRSAWAGQAELNKLIASVDFAGSGIVQVPVPGPGLAPPPARIDGRLLTVQGAYPLVLASATWFVASKVVLVTCRVVGLEAAGLVQVAPPSIRDGTTSTLIRVAMSLWLSRRLGESAETTSAVSFVRAFPVLPWADMTGVANVNNGSLQIMTQLSAIPSGLRYGLQVGGRYHATLVLVDQYGQQALAGTVQLAFS